MIKRTRIPLYKKLFDNIRKEIDSGFYKIGDLLPSENDLCKTYKTTRPTVRQALSELSALGYIVRQHGKGSIVTEPRNGLGILSLNGVTAGIGKNNLKTEIRDKPVRMVWPKDFYYEISETERNAGCVYFSRLRHINGVPILYEETYISNVNLPRFTTHNLETHSLFDSLRKFYEIEIKEGEQKIWAIAADKKKAKLLSTKVNNPILHMKRRLKSNVKNVNIYSFLYCNTEEYFIQDYF